MPGILVENRSVLSVFLGREVKVDFYLPKNMENLSGMSLLLINDGQHMKEMGLGNILEKLYAENAIKPLLCVAIHAGTQRKMEYGVASQTDYLGRGDKAGFYTYFIVRELLPFIRDTYKIASFKERAFAGFSLGALMAFDIVFNHPEKFTKAGLFSPSFWWRSVDQTEKEYDDDKHRIMHQVIRNGNYHKGVKFFFQCGNMDETLDRNKNGIIDSIDDTLDVIKELVAKGYDREKDIYYLGMPDGKHDIATWGRAMPEFLKWGWGK
ncbi:MAG TPA: alpha/beta hydrolase-fold protein [Chitinophagaceae bacterium]|nr:alpha/beta hydrolase-fold protein [Chitinophagaceae bacterium]